MVDVIGMVWTHRGRGIGVSGGAGFLLGAAVLSACSARGPISGSSQTPSESSGGGAVTTGAAEGERVRSLGHSWVVVGDSVDGRPIRATTIGNGSRRIYLIGNIHGNEPEGHGELEDLLSGLRESSVARWATLRVVESANPDGLARGSRHNARGVDLNRNWPASNFRPAGARGSAALSEPETQALHRDLRSFAPDVVIAYHSTAGGPFVNFDGPAEASEYARAFADAASSATGERWRVVPDMGYPTPGSLGSYLGVDQGAPVLTIEFKRGQSARSARLAGLAGIASVAARMPDAP